MCEMSFCAQSQNGVNMCDLRQNRQKEIEHGDPSPYRTRCLLRQLSPYHIIIGFHHIQTISSFSHQCWKAKLLGYWKSWTPEHFIFCTWIWLQLEIHSSKQTQPNSKLNQIQNYKLGATKLQTHNKIQNTNSNSKLQIIFNQTQTQPNSTLITPTCRNHSLTKTTKCAIVHFQRVRSNTPP